VIGVIPKPHQIPVVEEFFELFKTPWELHRPGRRYDVVVATADDLPNVDARLLLVFGSETKTTDAAHGIVAGSRRRGMLFDYRGRSLPMYGPVLTFGNRETAIRELVVPDCSSPAVIRLGYDLFDEVRLLLSAGQPVEHAHIPSLDLHIAMLRDWILNAGIPLLEIPPVPAGHSFISCLTHDIDFVGIRLHRFDRTMWGFLYRSTIGAVRNLLRRRISVARVLQLWRAALSLPFVYLGWARDFWEPFDWYLRAEHGLPATYFLIPFKQRAGEHVPGRHGSRRATAYDITGLSHRTATLMQAGCEVGVHGIDAWHSVDKGRDERARVTRVTGEPAAGTRSHWLLHDVATPSVLEQAGYVYDSTVGYNETVGYRAGTTQVFRPLGARVLLELPLHIQDGALFYPNRLDLSEAEAEKRCRALIGNAERFGGVLTVLWHDRSHGPERFWGHFYAGLLSALRSSDAWFGTASQVVDWFRRRREVHFESVVTPDGPRTSVRHDGDEIRPPLRIRVHHGPSKFVDMALNGRFAVDVDLIGLGSPS
jgi:hypothetical protein